VIISCDSLDATQLLVTRQSVTQVKVGSRSKPLNLGDVVWIDEKSYAWCVTLRIGAPVPPATVPCP
jgi:hypothetical protein